MNSLLKTLNKHLRASQETKFPLQAFNWSKNNISEIHSLGVSVTILSLGLNQ